MASRGKGWGWLRGERRRSRDRWCFAREEVVPFPPRRLSRCGRSLACLPAPSLVSAFRVSEF